MWESWILVLARSPTPCVPPRAWGSLPTLGAEAGVWAVGVPASMDAQLKMMPRRSEQELCTEDLPCHKLQTSPPHSSWSGRAYRALAAQGAGAQAGAVGEGQGALLGLSRSGLRSVVYTKHRGPWEAAWGPSEARRKTATFDPAEGRGGKGAPSQSCTAGQSKLAVTMAWSHSNPLQTAPLSGGAAQCLRHRLALPAGPLSPAQKPPFLKADPWTPGYLQATYVQAQHPATSIRKPN